MKTNLDLWDKVLEDMLAEGKELLKQGYPAREGLDRIHNAEKKLIERYNEYAEIYNEYIRLTPDLIQVWSKKGRIESIEREVEGIKAEFRAIPKLWY